jgi:hypothetical protein
LPNRHRDGVTTMVILAFAEGLELAISAVNSTHQLRPLLLGGLNWSTQHFNLFWKDGVFK